MRLAIAVVMALVAASFVAPIAGAAETQSTFGLIADGPYRTALATRIARGVDHRDGIRIFPVIGKSPAQNLADLAEVRGIDLALVPSDSLGFAEGQGLIRGVTGKFDYLVKLANLDIHVLAGPSIRSLADIEGKRVAVGPATHASYETSAMLFGALGLSVPALPHDSSQAIAAVKSGDAAAAVLVGVSPLPEVARLARSDGLHLVAIPPRAELESYYAPSLIGPAIYPNLLEPGQSVETVSSSLVLAAMRSPEGSRQQSALTRFATALFASLLEDGAGPGINLNAAVPGWTRSQASGLALESLGRTSSQSTAQEN